MVTGSSNATTSRSGLWYGLSAYGLWGVLPAYFIVLAPTGPFEIVAWRIVWSLVFCALLLVISLRRGASKPKLKLRSILLLGVTAILIYANWQIFVLAVTSDHVLDASLGYFINPLVTVVLGVLVLRERINRTQTVAVIIGAVAIAVMAIGAGGLPWLSLALALTFGLYGLIKHQVGPSVDAVAGMAVETAWITPIAAVVLVVIGVHGTLVFGHDGVANMLLLILAGPVTAIPLLLFASAARRLPLVTLGLIQFVAPILQFLFGLLVLHEAMPVQRWIGFALVWLSLVFVVVDMSRQSQRSVDLP